MLDSFYIKNFRLFKELKIKTLSRVNLITGKNNSGKSCFLEALRIYAANELPILLGTLVIEREESWENELNLKNETDPLNNPLRFLFYNYEFLNVIEIGALTNEHDRIRLQINKHNSIEVILEKLNDLASTYMFQRNFDLAVKCYEKILSIEMDVYGKYHPSVTDTLRNLSEIYEIQGMHDRADFLYGNALENEANFLLKGTKQEATTLNSKLSIEIKKNKKNMLGYLTTNANLLNKNDFFESLNESESFSKEKLIILPTQRLTENIVEILWDKISIKPALKQQVINALQLINNKIQDVVLIGKEKRIPILIYNDEKNLPLKNLGDGAIHLFHIILALVNAKDGMLLIDEFENGLHYSVQPKIWEVIFKLAEILNIQVFATTHSRDCIRAFYEIWSKPENNEKGCFFRLDHYPEKDIIRPMFYDLEALGDSFDVDGEMR
jgi:AAA15 family ATPase/GTPase